MQKDTPENSQTMEILKQRYLDLGHAMQTGVRMTIDLGLSDAHNPKHLRTGVNAAMADHGALVKVLISKGIISEVEYFTALVEMMQEEVNRYEASLQLSMGRPVKLY